MQLLCPETAPETRPGYEFQAFRGMVVRRSLV
jgi:hypothetical protein